MSSPGITHEQRRTWAVVKAEFALFVAWLLTFAIQIWVVKAYAPPRMRAWLTASSQGQNVMAPNPTGIWTVGPFVMVILLFVVTCGLVAWSQTLDARGPRVAAKAMLLLLLPGLWGSLMSFFAFVT